jgi:hypothetical protein
MADPVQPLPTAIVNAEDRAGRPRVRTPLNTHERAK